MKNMDRKKILIDAQKHLEYLKSLICKPYTDQEFVKEQIMDIESLINAIKNNETLIG